MRFLSFILFLQVAWHGFSAEDLPHALNVEIIKKNNRQLNYKTITLETSWESLQNDLNADFFRVVFPKGEREKAWELAQHEDFNLGVRSWLSPQMQSLISIEGRQQFAHVFRKIAQLEASAASSRNPLGQLAKWRELFLLQFFKAGPDLMPKKKDWAIHSIASVIYDSNLLLKGDSVSPTPVSDKEDVQSLAIVHYHKNLSASMSSCSPQAFHAQLVGLFHQEHQDLDLIQLQGGLNWRRKSSWFDQWWLNLDSQILTRSESTVQSNWDLYSFDQRLGAGFLIESHPDFFGKTSFLTKINGELAYKSHIDELLLKRNGSEAVANIEVAARRLAFDIQELGLLAERSVYSARDRTFDSETNVFRIRARKRLGAWRKKDIFLRPSVEFRRRHFPHLNGDQLIEELTGLHLQFDTQVSRHIGLGLMLAHKWKRDEIKTQLLGNQSDSNNKQIIQFNFSYRFP